MLEGLMRRAAALAARRVEIDRARLAEEIGAGLPKGVRAERTADGVALAGRGLRRRCALEPALRWLIAGLK